jgi:hypothetical protein
MLAAAGPSAQRAPDTPPGAQQFLGTWSGTWDGEGSSGGLELTLEKGKDDAITGRVAVTGDPTYKAALKSVSFDGPRMNARYDFTPDESNEVVLTGTFDGNTAKGTWSLRTKANEAEVARGTWTVTSK